MLKTIWMVIVLFGLRNSFWDREDMHVKEITEFKWQKKDKLGRGSFGTVWRLKVGDVVYAVKEIDLILNKGGPSCTIGDTIGPIFLQEFTQKVDSTEDFEYKDITAFGVFEILKSLPDTTKMEELLKEQLDHLKSEFNLLENEVEINKIISNAELSNPNRMNYKYNFCVRRSGLKFLVFMQIYGIAFSNILYQHNFIFLDIRERFRLYLELFRKVLFIHRQGIVHCDLKPDNILWTDKNQKEIVIADYGLATKGHICPGGAPLQTLRVFIFI